MTRNSISLFCFPVCNFKSNLTFFNLELVTQKRKKKSLIIKLVTRSEVFLFFNFELVTRKLKNENLPIKLVTRSEVFHFLTLS